MQMLGLSCEGVHAAPRRPPCPAQLQSRYTLTRSFVSQTPIALFQGKGGREAVDPGCDGQICQVCRVEAAAVQ